VRETVEGDEVDVLVDEWHRERSDLDLTPVEVFSRISRLSRHLDLARRDAFTEHDIEPWEFDVLTALRRAGKPYQLTPGRLIKETMVTSGTMTNRVDRLAERGFVVRSPDANDRRGVIVTLTAAGKRTVDAAFEELIQRERDLLTNLSASDRATLATLLRRLMAPFG
jgi:DNA-binding MarR family transcriptional regulator